ncbi:hypothetical protein RKD35_002157 [Streptomyces albogriseolus]
MNHPCTAPAMAPTARHSTTATGQGRSFLTMNTAAMEPTNAVSEPTDRSMWPEMMTSIMPIARIRM